MNLVSNEQYFFVNRYMDLKHWMHKGCNLNPKSETWAQCNILWLNVSSTAGSQVKQTNSKCRVWPLLPYSNRVGLDKKLSNNPERVSINLGTWPISNEALIAWYLIWKQHFNHAKTRVQFELTIRIVLYQGGGGVWTSDWWRSLVLLGPAR